MKSNPDDTYAKALHRLFIAVSLRYLKSASFRAACDAETHAALAHAKDANECLLKMNTER